VKPFFITKILRSRLTGLTVWKNFIRRASFKERESYICVVDGEETFKLVSPVYK
jgi:hypothetical protein